jgi:hypothetical protein
MAGLLSGLLLLLIAELGESSQPIQNAANDVQAGEQAAGSLGV